MTRSPLLLLLFLVHSERPCGQADRTGCHPERSEGSALDVVKAVAVVRGLDSPVYLTAPAGDARLFIVEQRGTIRIVKNGVLRPQPYLDIQDKLAHGGERGL